MYEFIKKVLLLSLVPMILILGIDSWLRQINSLGKEKYEGAKIAGDSIQVLILGTSHAAYGVDPDEFDLYAYNLANVSQRLYFDKRITLSLMDDMRSLKYVFISIDYHSLYTSSQGIRDFWSYYANGIKYKNKSYFLAELSPFLFGYTPRVSLALLKTELENSINYKKDEVLDFKAEDGVNITDTVKKGFLGYDGTRLSEFDDKYYFTKANDFTTTIRSANAKKEIVQDLRDFIVQLEDAGATPILFTSPTYKEYNAYLKRDIIERNIAEIKSICTTYCLEYWNYMNCELFERDDFHNANHLNKKGAKKFARLLNERLNDLNE